ncbi:MAG: riboflavin biosynthesis protein RibF [Elusimicrobia bacterium]|nr:riboflavin biosynthesis protein RibF [Elusimicrobiota bacterium]
MANYITIGAYDGVHLGHQKIIKAAVKESLKHRMKSVVLYFPLSPRFYFSGKHSNCLITLSGERDLLLKSMKIDKCESIVFDANVAAMSAEDFFNDIIIGRYDANGICVGHDFAFGRHREGNLNFLKKMCLKKSIHFKHMAFVNYKSHKISSSLIRRQLTLGNIEDANKCLGWNYSITGKVIKGARIGRVLGFPTANIDVPDLKIIPPGVFAVKIILDGDTYKGAANAGYRPTINKTKSRLVLEAHILDFDKMIYGRTLKIEFLKRLRGEKKFGLRESLKKQIAEDIRIAREYFSGVESLPRDKHMAP